jgi:hypothetical protein
MTTMPSEHNLSPILVTGAHRSGTTWAGKMLAADGDTAYISEPLNVLHRPGVFRAKVKSWYEYICDDNEGDYLPAYHHLLDYDYFFWDEIRSIRSWKDFLRMGRDFMIFYNALQRGQRALLKDPFAVFSIPWFVKKLDCQVVITVRHPAAFASSLQRLNWHFDFKDLLDQPLLLRDHLEPFREPMLSIPADDVIGQAALLWKMIYATVHKFCESHPELILVRHEEYSRAPVERFRELYAKLGLDFTKRAERVILDSSSSKNPAELKRTHSVKMDSAAGLKNWRKWLTGEDINRIRTLTEGVAELYYAAEDWG